MTTPIAAEVLPQERQECILKQLRRNGRVVANELAAEFGVSEDSIRRDLREMAAQGLCRRVYGGALLPTLAFPPLSERLEQSDSSRSGLATYAASLIRAGQVILLDAGSTNVEIAKCLRDKPVTVVTNAPAIAAVLSGDAAAMAVMIGGKIDRRSGGSIGTYAVAQLSDIQADVCIPGACAVDPDTGIWGIDADETAFKQAMVRASGQTIIVATLDKVGARGTYRIMTFDQVDHLVIPHEVPLEVTAQVPSNTRVHRFQMQ